MEQNPLANHNENTLASAATKDVGSAGMVYLVWIVGWKLIFVLALLSLPAAAQSPSVALTFDDLPLAFAGAPANATAEQRLVETHAVNTAILAALKRHHAHAIAFVNEKQVLSDGLEKEY